MVKDSEELQRIIDGLSTGATHIVSSPSTIKELQEKGLPIQSTFIPFEKYIEDLFAQKKKNALSLVKQLPQLDNSIASGVIAEIYDEIRSSYTLGILTSTIFNSILLLEYAMRYRLFNERLKRDPNSLWEDMEKLDMGGLISKLFKLNLFTKSERERLSDFSKNFRNPYFHINIQKLTKGVVITSLPQVDIKTKEVIMLKNVDASKNKYLWFAAKKFFDKYHVIHVVNFCVEWTNKLLTT